MDNLGKAGIMKRLSISLAVLALALAGCGGATLNKQEAEQYVREQQHAKLAQEQHREEQEVEAVIKHRQAEAGATVAEGLGE
jgi:hypothetical protein